jgi:hypothetical protein
MTDTPIPTTTDHSTSEPPPRPPTVEEWKAARAERLALGRAFAAERRAHPFIYNHCDLKAELRRYWHLDALQQKAGSLVPSLDVHYSATKSGADHVSGRAQSFKHHIVLTVARDATLAAVLESLLHEAVHLSLFREHHSDRFILRLVRAAAEAWNIKIARPLETTERGWHRKLAYAVDERIRALLDFRLTQGINVPPHAESPPPKAKPSPEERRLALQTERAEHATRMLTKNQRRLKLTQTRVKHWRARVRYYEKVAAKRGT